MHEWSRPTRGYHEWGYAEEAEQGHYCFKTQPTGPLANQQ